MIDIIIPVLNEEDILDKQSDYFNNLMAQAHLIFVDGGSQDRTVALASQYGEVLSCHKGRAQQKNEGIKAARSQALFFLHVDTIINTDVMDRIKNSFEKGAVAGCLTLSINDRFFAYRIFEWLINWRAQWFKVLDGDLGLFIRKDVFESIGGFDDVPIMEDILIGKKIKQEGRLCILSEKIIVSARKWKEQGFLKLLYEYSRVYIRLWTGRIVPQHR